ncbi:MAG: DNA adenine methylase [Treponema sp.]|jgi:DNA adenine methylase|nr:DNA adenine methylase [Treponema sp.]
MCKPFLKWAGGKRQLLPEIRKRLPENVAGCAYYEPFVGAGAVLFDLLPKKAVISDANAQLMLAYRAIRDDVGGVVEILRGYEKRHSARLFYEVRDMDRSPALFDALPDAAKAARLIYLNKTCFNGLYRVSAKGFFNVPLGRYKNPAICEERLLRRVSDYLNANDVAITSGDFEQAVPGIGAAADGAFVYFDPPYHSPARTGFTAYQPDGFGEQEQQRLRDLALRLSGLGAKCLLSNADTAYVRELYGHPQFEVIAVQAKRLINANAGGRGSTGELLIRSWQG